MIQSKLTRIAPTVGIAVVLTILSLFSSQLLAQGGGDLYRWSRCNQVADPALIDLTWTTGRGGEKPMERRYSRKVLVDHYNAYLHALNFDEGSCGEKGERETTAAYTKRIEACVMELQQRSSRAWFDHMLVTIREVPVVIDNFDADKKLFTFKSKGFDLTMKDDRSLLGSNRQARHNCLEGRQPVREVRAGRIESRTKEVWVSHGIEKSGRWIHPADEIIRVFLPVTAEQEESIFKLRGPVERATYEWVRADVSFRMTEDGNYFLESFDLRIEGKSIAKFSAPVEVKPVESAETAGLAMFGGDASRNFVSDEKGLPLKWNSRTGENIKWVVKLGSQTYAGPILAKGMVLVGTNNEAVKNPALKGDRGNVMAFREADGELSWQSAHAKLGAGRVNDWPLQGICSTPAIEGNRVYYVSNRAELICADINGFRDGKNDGPFKDESPSSEIDEDVIWKLDTIGEFDVFPHNLAAGSPLIVDDLLFIITGHGVDEGHINIPSPLGPSFIAVNKNSGELVWESALPGEDIVHGSWSNPSYGVIAGKPQVFFPGGDGWLYSFEPKTGKLIWKFNLNPEGSKWELGGRGTKNNVISMATVYGDKVYIGVGQDPEHGEAPGNFYALDATKTGDVTKTAVVWKKSGAEFNRTMSTASISDGLLYIADLSGFVYCYDLATGEQHWKYDAFAAIWGSTFVADGKVYIGDEDGDIAVLKAGKKMELLAEVNMGAAVYTTPVAKDGVIYVASRTHLFAIKDGMRPRPEATLSAAK